MSGFPAAWLALREPYDVAARNEAVLEAVAGAFRGQPSIAIVDLACGTGSTLRAIGRHLPLRQSWRMIDNDLGLLLRASTFGRPPDVKVATRPIDLARDLELALEPPLDLVTVSALLDLVSLEWLERLAIETAARRLPVYAALTYDGRAVLEPGDALDRETLAAFHAHLRTDKGFGPALGAQAAARAVERFEQVGYAVMQGRSDWVLGAADSALQEALFAGWAEPGTGTETETETMHAVPPSGRVCAWLTRRRSHLAAGRSRLRVGHVDIFARPMGAR